MASVNDRGRLDPAQCLLARFPQLREYLRHTGRELDLAVTCAVCGGPGPNGEGCEHCPRARTFQAYNMRSLIAQVAAADGSFTGRPGGVAGHFNPPRPRRVPVGASRVACVQCGAETLDRRKCATCGGVELPYRGGVHQ